MKAQKVGVICLLIFQVILIVLFAVFAKYDPNADYGSSYSLTTFTIFDSSYPMFQDIHVMIFVGFGFLMTFLKRYAFGAIGFTFFVSALVIQWGMLCQGLIRLNANSQVIYISITSLINADIIAAVILISLGAVLGKISAFQLFIMAVLETMFFVVNEYINVEVLEAVDAGGSMFVHAFGAYFGLTVSLVLIIRVAAAEENDGLEASVYQSDINSMIGTLFLWMFWPSFNAALLSGNQKYRAVINTYLSLTASCVTTFVLSAMFHSNAKFVMAHIQNATLAGGVCVGTSVNMMIQPYGALIIGVIAGFLSTIGFRFLQEILLKKMKIHDTCGVNNLHGMPGIAAGVIGAIFTALATQDSYGTSLYVVFPAMGDPTNRSAALQAVFQLIALSVTLLMSIIGGLITGGILRLAFPQIPPADHFDDELWWETSPDREQT